MVRFLAYPFLWPNEPIGLIGKNEIPCLQAVLIGISSAATGTCFVNS